MNVFFKHQYLGMNALISIGVIYMNTYVYEVSSRLNYYRTKFNSYRYVTNMCTVEKWDMRM